MFVYYSTYFKQIFSFSFFLIYQPQRLAQILYYPVFVLCNKALKMTCLNCLDIGFMKLLRNWSFLSIQPGKRNIIFKKGKHQITHLINNM